MKQKNLFIAVIALLIVAFAGGAFFYKKQRAEQAAQQALQNQAALIREGAPTFGKANAPVHIVEFFDPACDTCRQFYPLVKAMMTANPEKIRLTMRYAPFHAGSESVVKVLDAALKQGKFEQALEALFVNREKWFVNESGHVDLTGPILETVGLDMARLQSDANAPEAAAAVARDLADAKIMNVTMTPEYFVNGRPLPKFGFDELKQLVDEEIAKAK